MTEDTKYPTQEIELVVYERPDGSVFSEQDPQEPAQLHPRILSKVKLACTFDEEKDGYIIEKLEDLLPPVTPVR